MDIIQHAQKSPPHAISELVSRKREIKKPPRGAPCPTFTVMVTPGNRVGDPWSMCPCIRGTKAGVPVHASPTRCQDPARKARSSYASHRGKQEAPLTTPVGDSATEDVSQVTCCAENWEGGRASPPHTSNASWLLDGCPRLCSQCVKNGL